MTRPAIALILCIVFCSFSQAQSRTYQLIDGAAGDQAGHTLTGTITLDPACGSTCTSFDSWEYTVSGPVLNRSVSSNEFPPLFFNMAGLFTATPTELIVDFGGTEPDELLFDLAGLAWNVETPPGEPPVLSYFAYDFDGNLGAGWSVSPSPNPITIARVIPEPCSYSLLLAGIVPVLLCRSRRRSKL